MRGLFDPSINWEEVLRNNGMTDAEIVLEELNEFKRSQKLAWMNTGERYYLVDNEGIATKKKYRYTEDGNKVVDESVPNHKLAHGFAKNLTDDKVAYLLAKEPSLKSESERYVQLVRETLGQSFFEQRLETVCEEATNKGIGWLHPYVDEEGNFKVLVIPAQQVVPIWSDDDHTELQAVIRFFKQVEYIGRQKQKVERVELYTKTGVLHLDNRNGVLLPNTNFEVNPAPYITKNGVGYAWDAVPFVAVKNNSYEMPDIKFIKSLIDEYDETRSENANFLANVRRLIYVLKGYGGESLAEFVKNLNYFGAVNVDDPSEGDVDVVNPQVDLGGYDAHFQQLKRDILEFGQGVNKNLEEIGNAPSGIALKFLYSGLDLKCNKLEKSLKTAFRKLLEFVDVYLAIKGRAVPKAPVEIVFNRLMLVNETEAINNAGSSVGIVSQRTALAHHPWVQDVDEEVKQMEKEEGERAQAEFDRVPLNNGEEQR